MRRKQNGNEGTIFDLTKDGILWKQTVEWASEGFKEKALSFVANLQAAVMPADALEGMLLDRMASSYLRKKRLLKIEAALTWHRGTGRPESSNGGEGSPSNGVAQKLSYKQGRNEISATGEQAQDIASSICGHTFRETFSMDMLKYEAVLDRIFHQDFVLLQQMKRTALTSTSQRQS
jgi:hypothetical protein